MNKAVMGAGPGEGVAEHESDGGADETDEKALKQEDAANLAGLDPHGHEDGNVFGLFHHHHGKGDEDIEGGDAHDETNDDEGDVLLEFQGAEEFAVLLHPVGGGEAGAGGLLDLVADDVGAVKIVDAEGNDGDDVGLAEQGLSIGEPDETEA